MVTRLRVFVAGHVQGVAFRYSTVREAQRLGLAGWVRNLPDGRVEAEFEGERCMLEQMLDWCHHGPRMARVTGVDFSWAEGAPKYDGFHLRY